MPPECPDRSTLRELLAGKLAGRQVVDLTTHLEYCEDCSAAAGILETNDKLVLALRGSFTSPAAGDPDVESLINRITSRVGIGSFTSADSVTTARPVPTEDTRFDEILSPAVRDDEIGRLGPYRVLKVLGSGGMGVVFLAEEPALSRKVALKVSRPALAGTPGVRERFLREARAIAAVDDDRIVSVHHVGEERGCLFIAMQLLHGLTLDERLKEAEFANERRILPLRESIRIAREIARGLTAAHARGVIHRDIKPGNVFLKDGTEIKLLDFGLARSADDEAPLTQFGQVMGTPAYVAPEQSAGLPTDPRADLYGLGCILFRMTTGQNANQVKSGTAGGLGADGLGAGETPSAHLLNPEIPLKLSLLISALLAKDPTHRPASALDVVDRLTQIGDSLPGNAAAATSQTPSLPPVRRNRLVTLAATILTLAMLVIVIVIAFDRKTGELSVDIRALPAGSNAGKGPANQGTRIHDEFEEWIQAVARLTPEQQAKAVAEKIQERNPGFDGNYGPRFEDGQVVEFHILTDSVSDISPIRALPSLEYLVCRGSRASQGILSDISAVKSLKSLRYFDCSANPIQTLAPLRGSSIRELICWATPVTDLKPLENLRLTALDLNWTFVSDLAPLRDMPLTRLSVRAPYITVLDPIETMPLVELDCRFRPTRHFELLQRFRSLRTINKIPAAEFLRSQSDRQKDLDDWIPGIATLPPEQQLEQLARKLQAMNPEFDGKLFPTIVDGKVTQLLVFVDKAPDMAAVRALPALTHLSIRRAAGEGRAPLHDLDFVRSMSLDYLECGGTEVADLSPLAGSSLKVLSCWGTWVRDFKPLRETSVFYLDCRSTPIKSLKSLAGTGVRRLDVRDCEISDFSALRELHLISLKADLNHQRDAAILTSIKSLTEINDQPAAEFFANWNQRN